MVTQPPVTEYIDGKEPEFLDDLCILLAQPSVSATSEGIEECAQLITELGSKYGFDEGIIAESDGLPSVILRAFADNTPQNDLPTVLIYGHYDVQPVEPSQWTTPPFEPDIREDDDGQQRIYARGAGDNKGQWFTHCCAIKTLRETTGLPINVTLLLEGEEESGSPNIRQVVSDNVAVLNADLVYNADGPLEIPGRPELILGTRGLLSLQIEVSGPKRELHSGNYGGPIQNPAWSLVQLLASLRSSDGWISVDGFYDSVREKSSLEDELIESIPLDNEDIQAEIGISGFAEGPGEAYLDKLLFYPTMNIAGITSGYSGGGTKTAIPPKATAKIDMRLVEDQNPDTIYRKILNHIAERDFGPVDVSVEQLGSMTPLRIPPTVWFREPIEEAVEETWGMKPITKPSAGGAGPYYTFYDVLDASYIAVPYANHDENNHGPNENLRLDYFERGIRTTIQVLSNLAESFPDDRLTPDCDDVKDD